LGAILLALLTGGIFAADPPPPLVTDRPDVTESSETVARGLVQIEGGFGFSRFEQDGESLEVTSFPATLVRVGLDHNIELRLEWAGMINESRQEEGAGGDDTGTGSMTLGAKIKLREERGAAPQLALLADAALPTGSRSLRTERIDPGLRLAGSHTLTDRLGLGYNAGVAAASLEDESGETDTHGLGRYSAALAIGINERWASFVELYGFVPLSGPEPTTHLFDAGITCLSSKNVQLDFSAGLGLTDDAEDWFVGAGISFRLPR
jgi:hypothetical protein